MVVKPVKTIITTRAEVHPKHSYCNITTDNRKWRITLVQLHQGQFVYMHTWGEGMTTPPVHWFIYPFSNTDPFPLLEKSTHHCYSTNWIQTASVCLYFFEPGIIVCIFKQKSKSNSKLLPSYYAECEIAGKTPAENHYRHPLLIVTQVLMLWGHQTSPVYRKTGLHCCFQVKRVCQYSM